jgi:hypothetical protein
LEVILNREKARSQGALQGCHLTEKNGYFRRSKVMNPLENVSKLQGKNVFIMIPIHGFSTPLGKGVQHRQKQTRHRSTDLQGMSVSSPGF